MLTNQDPELTVSRSQLAAQMLVQLPEWGEWVRSLKRVSTPFGELNFEESAVLYNLRSILQGQSVSAESFAAWAGVKTEVVAEATRSLEELGLLTRQDNGSGPDTAPLQLTARVMEASEWAEDYYSALLMTELDRVPTEDLQHISSALDQIYTILQRLRQR